VKAASTQTGLDLRLLDRRSSIPLASAVANIVWDNARVTTEHADIRGNIAVNLPQGSYDVLVVAAGYMSSLFRGIGVLDGQRVEVIRGLSPGQGPGDQEKPASAIGGMVLDRLEHPIANIIVQATSGQHNYTVRSDRHGCYVIHNVIPGTYEIVWRAGDRALFKEEIPVPKAGQLIRYDARLRYL
jgi:hypothetical protein